MNKELITTITLISLFVTYLNYTGDRSIPLGLVFIPLIGFAIYFAGSIIGYLLEQSGKTVGQFMEKRPYVSLVSFLACIIGIIALL